MWRPRKAQRRRRRSPPWPLAPAHSILGRHPHALLVSLGFALSDRSTYRDEDKGASDDRAEQEAANEPSRRPDRIATRNHYAPAMGNICECCGRYNFRLYDYWGDALCAYCYEYTRAHDEAVTARRRAE